MSSFINFTLKENASESLKKIDSLFSNPKDILNSVAINLEKSVNKSFETERDPDTLSPWVDLNNSTTKKKKLNKKLQKTLRGRNSVKFYVRKDKIYISFEDYMIYHIVGTSKIKIRNFVPTPKESEVLKFVDESVKRVIKD